MTKKRFLEIYDYLCNGKPTDDTEYIDAIIGAKKYLELKKSGLETQEMIDELNNATDKTTKDLISLVSDTYDNADFDIQYILKNDRIKMDKIRDIELESKNKEIEQLNNILNENNNTIQQLNNNIKQLNAEHENKINTLKNIYKKQHDDLSEEKNTYVSANILKNRTFVAFLERMVRKFFGKYDKSVGIYMNIGYDTIEYMYRGNIFYAEDKSIRSFDLQGE